MRNKREYDICKHLAYCMRVQYPNLLFHYDLAGLNLSMAQAGMMKALQKQKGFPDLQILETRGGFAGCFLEIKREGTKIFKRDGVTPVNEHIAEQVEMIKLLNRNHYYAKFSIGLDEALKDIGYYMNMTKQYILSNGEI